MIEYPSYLSSAVMSTVPSDLPHTDSPAHRPLTKPRVEPPQPGHPAGPAALPLLGVPLVRQLGPGVPLEPVPVVLEWGEEIKLVRRHYLTWRALSQCSPDTLGPLLWPILLQLSVRVV